MTTTVLFGDLRTGRITDTLDALDTSWEQALNDAGNISPVTVAEDEVRAKSLRQAAQATRTFIAVDVDGVLQEAGPLWSRSRDFKTGKVTLGAAGLWSLFDHRKVLPVLAAGQVVQGVTTTASGTTLGGIACILIAQAMTHVGGNLPLVFPPVLAGDHTETFPGWKLLTVGDQLRELTKRETAAPDIRFRPRYQTDRRFIEWVLEVGTEDEPLLTQVGDDWIFDTTVQQSPVVGINTDEDASIMAERGWVTGNGSEEGTLIATAYDSTLVDSGFPLLEAEEARSSVEEQTTLDGHAANLIDRLARPIEVWKVVVRADAAAQVMPGHYAQVVTKGDAWLGTGTAYMRVQSKSGDLGGDVTLTMYPMRAVL